MSAGERRRALLLGLAIAGLHVLGAGLLLASSGAIGLGVGVTAYTLGMRHAFDADHIAAIDGTTRKLMADGQRPLSVGFWFSLGHSTVVFALGALVVLGVRGLNGAVQSGGSALHETTSLIGPVVSGTFLLLIGLLNLVVLLGVVRLALRVRRGELDEAAVETGPVAGGVLTRIYGRATGAVRASWHMYPLGVLFGLGFDTATEVALLVLAGGAAASGLPFYAILCLPLLFAAGMALFDTLDGAFMNVAYGWAFSRPIRKLYYNIAVTGLSVAVALVVGSIELLAVLADRLGLTGGPWDVVAAARLDLLGYLVAGLFVLTWTLAVALARSAR